MLPRDGPPAALCRIAEKIEAAGYAVYLVGGALRDAILADTWLAVSDWDLATAARPEQVAALFPGTIPIGIKHGTVKVITADLAAEVTTFRIEKGYSDHRRPDRVSYAASIYEDLRRRDFTINAMAYEPLAQVFVDPYCGMQDLRLKLVRAVGQPVERLAEDHLRLLRAVRFASTLGFRLDRRLAEAIFQGRTGVKTLAWERISGELAKILRGPFPVRGFRLLSELGLLREILPELAERDLTWNLKVMAQTPPSLRLRLAALLAGGDAEELLLKFCLPRTEREKISLLLALQLETPNRPEPELRRFLARAGEEALDLVALWRAQAKAGKFYNQELEAELGRIVRLACALPVKISDLAIDGRRVMELLAIPPGPQVGVVLKKLLAAVIVSPELNERAILEQLTLSEKE